MGPLCALALTKTSSRKELTGSVNRWEKMDSSERRMGANSSIVMLAAADTLLKKQPAWDPADGSIDIYYWYYGSYALFQMGGSKWKRWRKSLEKALLPSQIWKGHSQGSWDPISAWGESGGRVYTTALSILTLEVYYRFSRLLR
jgi:hypothetical protein